jgi:glutamate-1-semialdehyde 2,1-aminomutase
VQPVDGPNAQAYWERADRLLPGGGIYLTRSARFAGSGILPGFIASGEGCRVIDVDGKEYIDFLCANGPILLGYRHPEVDEAARRQMEQVNSASFFPPALVELAERLVERTSGMSWAVPAKNGSDVVALGARVTRAATRRDKLILFERAYHGFDPEWVPGGAGVPTSHRDNVLRVAWNDSKQLERVAHEHRTEIGGIVLNPLDQNPALDTIEPTEAFLRMIDEVRRQTGSPLVFDDIRAGFRMHASGSHVALGVQPDLICLGKALGNGYAVSALLGTEELRAAARSIMFTASFAFDAIALRAAVATLEVYDRDDAFVRIHRAGERLRDGLVSAAKNTEHRIRYTGPPTMPTLLFEDDPNLDRGRRFSLEAAARGALFHPNLNWFLNASHDDAAVNEAVSIAEEAFRATPPPADS